MINQNNIFDGSVVESTFCSYRGPTFRSQQLHGDSQSSVTPVLGDPTPSSAYANVVDLYT